MLWFYNYMLWFYYYMLWFYNYILWVYYYMLWIYYYMLWVHNHMLWFHYYMLWFHYYMLWVHNYMLWVHYYMLWVHNYMLWVHNYICCRLFETSYSNSDFSFWSLHLQALSADTKDNGRVTLTETHMLKIAFQNFVVAGRIVFHKHILFQFINIILSDKAENVFVF